jgi:hypothetical protein
MPDASCSIEETGTMTTYSVYTFWGDSEDDDELPKRLDGDWLLRDGRAPKWRLRKWLRKLRREGWTNSSIYISAN